MDLQKRLAERAAAKGPSPPQVQSVQKSLSELLGEDSGGKRDDSVVERIRNGYTKSDIAGSRAYRALGSRNDLKSLITQLLALDPNTRSDVFQAVSGVGDVPAGEVRTFIDFGTLDELRVAQNLGRASGLKQVTRFTLLGDLLSLGPGDSGALVSIGTPPDGKDPAGRICLTYGLKGSEPQATFTFPVESFAIDNLDESDNFFDTLIRDGHEIQKCFGKPAHDFFFGLFACAYTGAWSGTLNRMVFRPRPHVETFKCFLHGKANAIMDPQKGIFGKILTSMFRHYGAIPCPENPVSHFAWLREHLPADYAHVEMMSEVVRELSSNWQREYREIISALEGSFVEFLVSLDDPTSVHLAPKSFAQAIERLSLFREYRGKEEGEGLASFLNEEMKDVGTRPLGVFHDAVPDDIRRFLPSLEELVRLGHKTISLYSHLKRFPIVAYVKEKLGVTLRVYTTATNTSGKYDVRDFMLDGRDRSDDATAVIIDVKPDYVTRQGEVPLLAEWNAHAAVLEKIKSLDIRTCVVFSRIITEKVAVKVYQPDLQFMSNSIDKNVEVAVSFNGVRHHNGEFIYFLCRDNPPPLEKRAGSKLEFMSVRDKAGRDFVITGLVAAISTRIYVSNEMRLWASPMGAWASRPAPYIDGTDSYALDMRLLRARTDDSVRAALSESHTVSVAAGFGARVADLDWSNAPEAFRRRVRKTNILPVNAAEPSEDVAHVEAQP